MIEDLKTLEPAAVFSYFADICSIPHISGHEEKIGEYLLNFAAQHGLKAVRDQAGNVIIDKPASAGREQHPRVILQGHQDMVPAKRPDSQHDFLKDPICPVIHEGRIMADGTSLGADDGIGLSIAMALLADDKLEHGPLRAIFTVEEETSMKGACELDAQYLDADYLINIDSEEDGYIFIASAGSQDMEVSYVAPELEHCQDQATDLSALTLRLIDLSGGHSGTDIHLDRANAIKLLTTLLLAQSAEFDFNLTEIKGGTVRNAIPNQAELTLCLKAADAEAFKQSLLLEFEKFRLLYQDTDPHMRLEIHQATLPAQMFSFADTIECLSLIENLPHGAERFFAKDRNVVETSCNLGLISTQGEHITMGLLARSLNDFALDLITDKTASLCYLSDKTEFAAPHREPCWQSESDNELIRALCRNYKKVSGREMLVTALHAGLETAEFAAKNPRLQVASLGPTVRHPHSAVEYCDIKAINTAYEMLRRTLAEL